MSQLSRGAMKLSRLIGTAQPNRRLPSAFFISPKLFSTGASEQSLGFSDDQFLRTPLSGLVYGRLNNIAKHTTKSDIINLLEGCNLSLEKLKVEYNRDYLPLSMVVEFPSRSSYDAALRAIGRKGRLYLMTRADKAEWDTISPYDGKAILLQGIPRNALNDDVERFLSGCQYYSSSIQMFVRPTNQGPIRMALVRFPSQGDWTLEHMDGCLGKYVTSMSINHLLSVNIALQTEKANLSANEQSRDYILHNRRDSSLLLKYCNLYQMMGLLTCFKYLISSYVSSCETGKMIVT